jgi:SPP1 gp7 family putative phage head morphogenesis protein
MEIRTTRAGETLEAGELDGAALNDARKDRLGQSAGTALSSADHEEGSQAEIGSPVPRRVNRESAVRDAAFILAESLKHPRHAATLAPAKLKLAKLLRKRFNRQHKRFIRESKKWMTWLAAKYSEAAGDLKAGITHTVNVNISAGTAVTQPPSQSDSDAYEDIVGTVAEGAVATISVDLASVIADATAQANAAAESWLRDNSMTKLASDVDKTTREQLANGLAEVYAKGGTYADAVQSVKDTFTTATDYRADMIAQTELNDVYNQTLLDSAKEAGGMLKTWEPDGECCDECQENVDAGPIAIDDDFPSGDDAPPLHPHCDCSIGFQKEE